jgi:hypothetical protein
MVGVMGWTAIQTAIDPTLKLTMPETRAFSRTCPKLTGTDAAGARANGMTCWPYGEVEKVGESVRALAVVGRA